MESSEDFSPTSDDLNVEYDCSDYSSGSFDDSNFENDSADQQMQGMKYEVLSASEIFTHMTEDIEYVSSVTKLSKVMSRVLLDFFHWDTSQLTERFFNDGCDKLCKQADIGNPEKSEIVKTKHEKPTSELLECNICYMEYKVSEMKGGDCTHLFCNTCWTFYIKYVINQVGRVNKITCPAYNCNFLVDNKIVIEALAKSNDKQKYQQLLLQSYVSWNRALRWCPYLDCSYAIKMGAEKIKNVVCKCKSQFCFYCGEGWHDPVPCNLLKRWNSRWNDDSQTSCWIHENTKDCPKCNVIIEKKNSCDNITCSQCLFQFCWQCLKPKSHFDFHECNFLKKGNNPNSKSSKREVDLYKRYKFFWSRYVSQTQSQRLEKLYFTEKKLEHLKHCQHIYVIKNVFKILSSCRKTLLLTYMFAFYLERNNQSIIFNENQTNFEKCIENLSKCLKTNLEHKDTFNANDLENKAFCCEKRRTNLLEHVREGNDKFYWKYLEDN